jgi:hypothetical protein
MGQNSSTENSENPHPSTNLDTSQPQSIQYEINAQHETEIYGYCFNCDICDYQILSTSIRFHCTTCSSLRRDGKSYSSFDICKNCYENSEEGKKHQKHKVRECEKPFPLIKSNIGFAESIWNKICNCDGVCLKTYNEPWFEYYDLVVQSRSLQTYWIR